MPDLTVAQQALADEWRAKDPVTPEDILAFYRETPNYGPDLDAWHATKERQSWTTIAVHVAQATQAVHIVDIGCGAGHDLLALWEALPDAELHGVEPNHLLCRSIRKAGIDLYTDVAGAPIESADLLLCLDVLEHVVDPETFLGDIARRARVGCHLIEATATWDGSTPLHLAANRGWHPGRVLERHGWTLVDQAGDPTRIRVWRRDAEAGPPRAGLLLCAYRGVTTHSLRSIMAATGGGRAGWRVKVKDGDALIARSRSIIMTDWWRSTDDDVALMIDDDITFTPDDADHVVGLCRQGRDIVCGAYPVRDGAHLALQYMPGTTSMHFHPDEPPAEIRYAATGFMAVHRRVLDALIPGLPLLHPREVWSFHHLFPTMTVDDPTSGPVLLSEDWAFCELARRAGFKIWLDPAVRLKHASSVQISIGNMADINAALKKA